MSDSSNQKSKRFTVSLDKYLQEIGEVDLITPEEEIELARRVREGDTEALRSLISANLRFVVSVAKQYQNQGIGLEDLINEGNLGLIKAAKRFDETRGFKFISYSVWWIRQSILHALAEQSRMVRLPVNRVGTLKKISRTSALLEQIFEREPTSDEISDVLEISVFEVDETIRSGNRTLSVDSPFRDEENNNLLDVLSSEHTPQPDESLIEESLNKEIDRALSTLSPREAEIIRLYFGLKEESSLTLEEIGLKFNLTRERVRQIKENALRRLRVNERGKELRSYLGR
ncbi:RNA polymerase sigma factor RpoD/SigA [bacterium]|nr:RNA polymerase sigma factor RpoD/SigA [bacterium]